MKVVVFLLSLCVFFEKLILPGFLMVFESYHDKVLFFGAEAARAYFQGVSDGSPAYCLELTADWSLIGWSAWLFHHRSRSAAFPIRATWQSLGLSAGRQCEKFKSQLLASFMNPFALD